MKKTSFISILACSILFITGCGTDDNQGSRDLQNQTNPVSFGGEPNPNKDANNQIIQDRDGNRQFTFDKNRYEQNAQNNQKTTQNRYTDRNYKSANEKNNINKTEDRAFPDAFSQQVIQLTNREREKKGLQPLQNDPGLAKIAQLKSEDMVANDYFSHTSPTYGTPFQMLDQFGITYTTAAENIAAGQSTPQEVVTAWMNSEGHRRNILNKKVTHIGIGHANSPSKGIYWTQMFIKK